MLLDTVLLVLFLFFKKKNDRVYREYYISFMESPCFEIFFLFYTVLVVIFHGNNIGLYFLTINGKLDLKGFGVLFYYYRWAQNIISEINNQRTINKHCLQILFAISQTT